MNLCVTTTESWYQESSTRYNESQQFEGFLQQSQKNINDVKDVINSHSVTITFNKHRSDHGDDQFLIIHKGKNRYNSEAVKQFSILIYFQNRNNSSVLKCLCTLCICIRLIV